MPTKNLFPFLPRGVYMTWTVTKSSASAEGHETMPEVGFKQNVLRYTNSPLITVKRNVYAVKLNDEVVYRPCMEGRKRHRTF